MKTVLISIAACALATTTLAQDKGDGRRQPEPQPVQRGQLKRGDNRPQQPVPPPRPTRSDGGFIRTAPEYRHIQIRHRERMPDTKLDVREIGRVMNTPSLEVYRFDAPRITQVETVVRLLESGDRGRAIRTWGGFVASLRDRDDPVDLDSLMRYIARESCFGQHPAARFHAQRLAHLQQAQDDTRFYLAQLQANLRNLHRGRHGDSVRAELEIEIARAEADLRILEIREQHAVQRYDLVRAQNDRYEREFVMLYNDLYDEAVQRIRITQGRLRP